MADVIPFAWWARPEVQQDRAAFDPDRARAVGRPDAVGKAAEDDGTERVDAQAQVRERLHADRAGAAQRRAGGGVVVAALLALAWADILSMRASLLADYRRATCRMLTGYAMPWERG